MKIMSAIDAMAKRRSWRCARSNFVFSFILNLGRQAIWSSNRRSDAAPSRGWLIVLPRQRILPSKESRTTQIGNPKPQENPHAYPAFLQNRLLAQVKSSRSINRFRILHGRLSSSPWIRGAPQSGFATLMSRMSWRMSADVFGRPPRPFPVISSASRLGTQRAASGSPSAA